MPDLLSPVLAITCGSRIKRGRSGGGCGGRCLVGEYCDVHGQHSLACVVPEKSFGLDPVILCGLFCRVTGLLLCQRLAQRNVGDYALGWPRVDCATWRISDLVRWTRAFQRNAGCSKTVSLHETASFLRGAALCARQYWRLFLAFMQLHNFRPPKGGGVAGSRARAPGAGRKMLRPWRMRSRCEAFWRCVIRCAKSS